MHYLSILNVFDLLVSKNLDNTSLKLYEFILPNADLLGFNDVLLLRCSLQRKKIISTVCRA